MENTDKTEVQEIEIEISTTTIEKKKIKIPAYFKHNTGSFYYKVFSEKECVQVFSGNFQQSIQICNNYLALSSENNAVSEEDFTEAYKKVAEFIKTKAENL